MIPINNVLSASSRGAAIQYKSSCGGRGRGGASRRDGALGHLFV